jgi:beta-xylosidase
VSVLVAALAIAARPAAGQLAFHNPLRDAKTGRPISCPDPSVDVTPHVRSRFVLVCTSDNARDAFPIWTSSDLVRWARVGSVFPRGTQPGWAAASTGGRWGGRFWAPQLFYVAGRWVLYFAAVYDFASGTLNLPASLGAAPGTMVIGVATAGALGGPWRPRILHYRGQFNAVNSEQEDHGGAIDPSVVRDPRTGRLYLFWAEQTNEIWAGSLSGDGLTLDSHIHQVIGITEPWECDAANNNCTVEGPEPFYANGRFYLLYSAASTWDSSYAVGVAASPDPLDPSQPFIKLGHPILATGNGFLGPGRTSHPIIGPDGRTYILYHALMPPLAAHVVSAARVLMLGRLNWVGGWPMVNDGLASAS